MKTHCNICEICGCPQIAQIDDSKDQRQRAEDGDRRSEIRGERSMEIKSAKDLRVYQKAYALAMQIYELSKFWPAEERYSLTDQIRRSSRSVCANLREAWAKRLN